MISDISRFRFRFGTDMFSASFGVCVHNLIGVHSRTGLESHDIWDVGFLSRGGFYHMFIFAYSCAFWSFGFC